MRTSQLSFPAFAAFRAATVCPPAGAVQAANESSVVTHKGSGQRVDARTHAQRRDDRHNACIEALGRRGLLQFDRWVLVQHSCTGPFPLRFVVRPSGRPEEFSGLVESLHRVVA